MEKRQKIPAGTLLVSSVLLLLAQTSGAQAVSIAWHKVPGAKGLTNADKSRAAGLMNRIHSYYGCSDSVSRCLRSHPKCETARRLAGLIVRLVRQGRTDAFIRKELLDRARSMHPFKIRKVSYHKEACTGDPAKALVVVAAFADFQCPFCKVVVPALKKIVARYKGRVVLCFKHFPTQMHGKNSVMSARAAVAAARQGKFWAMFRILYHHRKQQAPARVEQYAASIGLDMARFKQDRDSRATRRLVALDKREGLKLGVKGTPTLFLDGKMWHGRKDAAELTDRIEEELVLRKGGQ